MCSVLVRVQGISQAENEEAEPTADQVLSDLNNVGQINIRVSRGVQGAKVETKPVSSVCVPTASKDVVKKNHVSHSTSDTAIGEHRLHETVNSFEPATFDAHHMVTLILRFRSRTSLQLLKIIPDEDDDYSADATHHSNQPAAGNSVAKTHPTKVLAVDKKCTAEVLTLGEPSRKKKSTLHLPSQPVSSPEQSHTVAIKKGQNDNIKVESADDNSPKVAQLVPHEQSSRRKTTADRKLSAPNSQQSSTRSLTSSQASVLQPHQLEEAIVIKEESDDDFEIIRARSTPRAQLTPHSSTQPAPVSATQTLARKRASAKLRLEMLKVKKQKLEVEREELELRQEMLELE